MKSTRRCARKKARRRTPLVDKQRSKERRSLPARRKVVKKVAMIASRRVGKKLTMPATITNKRREAKKEEIREERIMVITTITITSKRRTLSS